MALDSPPRARALGRDETRERPLRADALRNRASVLRAARETFASDGSDAQMEDVARRAGVGIGTVYRHFQTKDALIDALLNERFSQMTESVRAALAIKDSWLAITEAFQCTARLQAQDRCLAGALAERKPLFTTNAPIMRELHAVWAQLLDRGQRDGVIREDISAADIPNLMCALASVVGRSQPSGWERYLGILLDGLHADASRSVLVVPDR